MFRNVLLFVFLFCYDAVPAQVRDLLTEKKSRSYVFSLSYRGYCKGAGADTYTCGAKAGVGIVFQHSADNGHTWTAEKTIAPYKPAALKPVGHGPMILCDTVSTAYRGRIYVCWSDHKNGKKNEDVFLVYSDDRGESWTEPILVSYRPNHRQQFDPIMTTDKNGRLYMSYFDRQNYMRKGCDLYLAVSDNGGLLFSYYRLAGVGRKKTLLNHYLFLDKHSTQLSWYDKTFTWQQWMGVVKDSSLAAYSQCLPEELQVSKSFSFAERINIPFNTNKTIKLGAVITKPLEPGFEKVIFKNKKFKAGKRQLVIDTKALGLQKGNYVITFYYDGTNSYSWILED